MQIFDEVVARVSSAFVHGVTESGQQEDFFTNVSRDAGATCRYDAQQSRWFLEGDIGAINKACQLLSTIYNLLSDSAISETVASEIIKTENVESVEAAVVADVEGCHLARGGLPPAPDVKRHSCSVCPKTFVSLRQLKRHEPGCHPIQRQEKSGKKRGRPRKERPGGSENTIIQSSLPGKSLLLATETESVQRDIVGDLEDIKPTHITEEASAVPLEPRDGVPLGPCEGDYDGVEQGDRSPQKQRRRTRVFAGEEFHPCPECDLRFSTPSNMYRHLRKTHEKYTLMCIKCRKQFDSTESLQNHVMHVHQSLRCPQCLTVFYGQADLASHECPKQEDGCLRCPKCPKIYTKRSNLNKHYRVEHEGFRYNCDICDIKYTTKENLLAHYKAKHEVIPCRKCESVFVEEASFVDHMAVEHRIKVERVGDVPEASVEAQSGVRLLSSCRLVKQEVFHCQHCQKPFGRLSNLNKHIRIIHENFRLVCDQCPRTFKQKNQLIRHQKVKHEGLVLPCQLCDKAFSARKLLARHQLEEHHRLALEGVVQCEHCGKSFLYEGNLWHHIRRVHEGVRYQCQTCERAFSTAQKLKDHCFVDHEGRRYACEECPKSFRRKDKLKEHKLDTHGDDTAARCGLCGLQFARYSALAYHKRKAHSNPNKTKTIISSKITEATLNMESPNVNNHSLRLTEATSGSNAAVEANVSKPEIETESMQTFSAGTEIGAVTMEANEADNVDCTLQFPEQVFIMAEEPSESYTRLEGAFQLGVGSDSDVIAVSPSVFSQAMQEVTANDSQVLFSPQFSTGSLGTTHPAVVTASADVPGTLVAGPVGGLPQGVTQYVTLSYPSEGYTYCATSALPTVHKGTELS